jgi:hypothetical protein
VEIVVTDPVGTQTSVGKQIADGQGDVDAEVAPVQQARNGVNRISLNGTVTARTAAASIKLTGASDADLGSTQLQWITRSAAESACQQCLLVHGQAP